MTATGVPGDEPGPPGRIGVCLGGRYLLGELLGVGGSAAVYAADDLSAASPGRVAVKVLHPHLCGTDQLRRAFLREAERASRVRHPNIVAVRGSGLHDAGGLVVAWIAFDLADGPTLSDWLDARGPLPPADAVAVMDGLLAALGAAHAAGLVHRDVGPRNVVLKGVDPAGPGRLDASMVRLLDFGLADVAGRTTVGDDLLLADASGGRTVVGNVAFLSPEQARGEPVSASADLYQAGALLYCLLTGRPPFPRGLPEDVVAAHLTAPAPVASVLAPGARRLDPVIITAMAKDPSRRYPDAAAFRDALRAAQVGGATTKRLGTAPSATRVLPLAAPGPTAARPAVPVTPRGSHGAGRPAAAPAARPETWELPAPAGGNPVILGVAATAVVVIAVIAVGAAPAGRGAAVTTSASATGSALPTPTPTPSRTAPARVRVPDLSGSLESAATTLRAQGFELGTVTRTTSSAAAGTVLSQSPAAGARVPPGTTVSLIVASGRNLVPDVTGLTVDAALSALRTAGFVAAADPADAAASAVVTGSVPAADAHARVGSTVVLVVEHEEPTPSAPGQTASGPPTSGPPTPSTP